MPIGAFLHESMIAGALNRGALVKVGHGIVAVDGNPTEDKYLGRGSKSGTGKK